MAAVHCALDPSFQFARDFAAQYSENLRPVDLMLPNLEEARLMTGRDSPEDCAAALRGNGARTVVVKLGANGCYVSSDALTAFVPSEPTQAIDATGAGDAFAGALLATILKGHGILQAAQRGNQVARCLVTNER